ncbi:MAG TPA: ACP S-malonyltransferase [Gemmatimonadales bacterium]|nr:ACP S-malonyltransferase [Gemmatimonadales bacterium]
MVATILLFPGQGAQKIGMGKDLADRFPVAADLLAVVDAALDSPITQVMWDGTEEELVATHNAQPAILAHSAAVHAVLAPRLAGRVVAAAGHSLGEYSAWMAAGALAPAQAARLVRRRGALMFEAGQARPGAMSAVLGLASSEVERICQESTSAHGTVVAANLNAPDQTVISGDPAAVEAAGTSCTAAGAKRVLPLKVSGAFHSPLMAPAVPGLTEALRITPFGSATFPVVANATAELVPDASDAAQLLAEQLTAPVRWVESMRRLATEWPDAEWLELGPGAVLGGLLKRIVPGTNYVALGTADQIDAYLERTA